MIITKIISNGKNEFQIELNNQSEIILSEDVFVRHNLYKGKEISSDDIEYLITESRVQAAIEISMRRLRNRKTEFEIRTMLSDEGFEDDVIEKAINYLYKYHFLDDREYAILYARDKTKINNYGQMKIAYILRQKGIPNEFIKLGLDEVFDQQFDIAWRLYSKRRHRYDLHNYRDRSKLANYLNQRGFTYDTIQSVIKRGQRE